MMTDPISDMLTRMRNSLMIKQKFAIVPFSKLKVSILEVLRKNGYIEDYKEFGEGVSKFIKVALKYDKNGSPVMNGLKKISKPGRRVYSSSKDLSAVLGGLGISIVSTPKGIMSNIEAKKNNLGGEVICEIF